MSIVKKKVKVNLKSSTPNMRLLEEGKISAQELSLFPTLGLEYLKCRTVILAKWRTNHEYISLKTVLQEAVSAQSKQYYTMAYYFLDRFRHINYGIMKLPPAQKPNVNSPTRHIIIVGAGMVGLTTAVELKNVFRAFPINLKITILESRDRVGGRILTFPTSCRDVNGYVAGVDLGTDSFSEDSEVMNSIIISQLGLNVRPIENKSQYQVYEIDGSQIDPSIVEASQNFSSKLLESRHDYPNISMHSFYVDALKKSPIYSKLQPLHFRLFNMHLRQIEIETHTSITSLRAAATLNDSSDCRKLSIVGGMSQLPYLYAQHIESQLVEIVYNKYVNQVECVESRKIFISTRDSCVNESDAVVITAPIGVIRENMLKFIPPLSPAKTNAIQSTESGLLNKIMLVFPFAFWDLDIPTFHVLQRIVHTKGKTGADNLDSSNLGVGFEFRNVTTETRIPVLVAVLASKVALAYERLTDDEIISDIMNVLARVFSDRQPLPMPIETVITRWGRDENSFGTSCSVDSEFPDVYYSIIAKTSLDRIFFAGDASNRPHPGSIEGAIECGMRVASELANSLLGCISKMKDI